MQSRFDPASGLLTVNAYALPFANLATGDLLDDPDHVRDVSQAPFFRRRGRSC